MKSTSLTKSLKTFAMSDWITRSQMSTVN